MQRSNYTKNSTFLSSYTIFKIYTIKCIFKFRFFLLLLIHLHHQTFSHLIKQGFLIHEILKNNQVGGSNKNISIFSKEELKKAAVPLTFFIVLSSFSIFMFVFYLTHRIRKVTNITDISNIQYLSAPYSYKLELENEYTFIF